MKIYLTDAMMRCLEDFLELSDNMLISRRYFQFTLERVHIRINRTDELLCVVCESSFD